LKALRPGRNLAQALGRHLPVDVVVAQLRQIEQERPRRAHRHLVFEAAEQDAFVLDHLRIEQAGMAVADGVRITCEANL
jgi:hypothetical protein